MPDVLGDRYLLIDKLGAGGWATVYRASDQRLGRDVALKLLRPEYCEDAAFIERLRHEAMLSASIPMHPNVVATYDFGMEGQTYYIAMEYVRGGSLKDKLEQDGRLPVAVAVVIAEQILMALEAAHRAGVIHRDVKPQNVLLTAEGTAKLADFGIARAASYSTVTPKGQVLATPRYVSPEQLQGQPASCASDIYSVGIVLYEMLTGKVPCEGDDPNSIAVWHLQGTPKPPRELVPSIPQSLESIVLKALAKLPDERWKSAEEMAAALQASLKVAEAETTQMTVPMEVPVERPHGENLRKDPPLLSISPQQSLIKRSMRATLSVIISILQWFAHTLSSQFIEAVRRPTVAVRRLFLAALSRLFRRPISAPGTPLQLAQLFTVLWLLIEPILTLQIGHMFDRSNLAAGVFAFTFTAFISVPLVFILSARKIRYGWQALMLTGFFGVVIGLWQNPYGAQSLWCAFGSAVSNTAAIGLVLAGFLLLYRVLAIVLESRRRRSVKLAVSAATFLLIVAWIALAPNALFLGTAQLLSRLGLCVYPWFIPVDPRVSSLFSFVQ